MSYQCRFNAGEEVGNQCRITGEGCHGGGRYCDLNLDPDTEPCAYDGGSPCASYRTCPCRECAEKDQCLETGCGELCVCRPDEDTDFFGKKVRLFNSGEIVEL